jgi:hypothetical protein
MSNFKKILDSLNGETLSLKKQCAEDMGVTSRTINRYYGGESEVTDLAFAAKFCTWANKRRVAGSSEIVITDLLSEVGA